MKQHNIRAAELGDIGRVLQLCQLHAEFEGSSCSATEAKLTELLFADGAAVRCLVAELEGEVVGYATFVRQHSTWRASSYLYLDALFLLASARGRGLGQALMHRVRDEARRMNCHHVEWQTPDFNADAIGFYKGLGAVSLTKERFFWDTDSDGTVASAPPENLVLGPPASLAEPYRPRPTVMSGERKCRGWRLKIYEIAVDGSAYPSELVDAALACFHDKVIWPTETTDKYGFAILHQGEQAMWAPVHLWVNDILRHFLFSAPVHDPTRFDVSPMPGFNACVWELEVTRHERDAWVEHVMSSPADPRFASYMQAALEIARS